MSIHDTPKSSAPNCTKVGTSEPRSTSNRTSGWFVANTILRLLSISSAGTIPAAAKSGSVCSRMRPLVRAMVSNWLIKCALLTGDSPDVRTQHLQFFFDTLVTAIDMVNAIHQRGALGHHTGDD